MNSSDFKQTAEKYRAELMKLYGKNNSLSSEDMSAQPSDVTDVTEETIENEYFEEELNTKEENTPEEQTTENANADIPVEKQEERFLLPIFPQSTKSIPEPEPNNSYGYLKVNVRTGNGGLPIKDSVVTVSEISDGKEHILRILSTDESGATEIIRLPAPSNSKGNSPQDYQSFAKYNISVYSKGFFRETSVDAPIFSDVTSIQNFYLIPEPFDYNSGERTIVDRNPEPLI